MNEQMIFQTISQVALQLKTMQNLTDADAVSRASSFVKRISDSAKTMAGDNNPMMFFQTISQVAIQYLSRESKTEDEAITLATSFVNSMKVEAATIVNS